MKNQVITSVLIVIAIFVGVAIRTPFLEKRPIHTDEAVHGIKFLLLLEKNFYEYDPHEYHGPTLNYFTLVPAYILGQPTLEVNELTLRIVPVFFGVALIAFVFFIKDAIGYWAAVIAAMLTALSPAFCYYSRYYIQEMLLVFFTFGLIAACWRYWVSKKVSWMVLAGLFLGLMQATKETWVIAGGALIAALILTFLTVQRPLRGGLFKSSGIKLLHILIGLAVAGVVYLLFYSSFFTNPQGVLDSFATYGTYFSRASDQGHHIKPWYYYLQLLTYNRSNGVLWTEASILLLAVCGLWACLKGSVFGSARFCRFLAFYALILTALYSLIPYKTPWSMLGFFHGLVVLAGIGSVWLYSYFKHWFARGAVAIVIALSLVHLGWQSYLANFKYYESPCNPYVYAHTSLDVFDIVERIEDLMTANSSHRSRVAVVVEGHDYWPLPWYLRAFPYTRWYGEVEDSLGDPDIIVVSQNLEKDLARYLYEVRPPGRRDLYVPEFRSLSLRPGIKVDCYVKKDFKDMLERLKAAEESSSEQL